MDLYGDNRMYGAEETILNENRTVLAIAKDEPFFPCGPGGLLPVWTMRKKGEKMVYAFPVGAADTIAQDSTLAEAEAHAARLRRRLP